MVLPKEYKDRVYKYIKDNPLSTSKLIAKKIKLYDGDKNNSIIVLACLQEMIQDGHIVRVGMRYQTAEQQSKNLKMHTKLKNDAGYRHLWPVRSR